MESALLDLTEVETTKFSLSAPPNVVPLAFARQGEMVVRVLSDGTVEHRGQPVDTADDAAMAGVMREIVAVAVAMVRPQALC